MLKIFTLTLFLTTRCFAYANGFQDGLVHGQQSLSGISQQLSKVDPNQYAQGSLANEQSYYQNQGKLAASGKAKLMQEALGQALQTDCQAVHDHSMAQQARAAGTQAASTPTPTDSILQNCAGQHCWHAKGKENDEFQTSLSKVSIWQMAGQDNFNHLFFNGQPANCREVVSGYLNCCQDKGWGKDLHLAKCSTHEQQLGQAKQKHQAILIGKYCHKKMLGKCVETRKSYCRFNSHLARIIQQNGRSQLHINFGNPKMPNCQGLNSQQLQQIDLSQMDFSEIYANVQLPNPQLNNTAKLPSKSHSLIQKSCP